MARLDRIEAVVFDVDDTLYRRPDCFLKAAGRVCALPPDPESLFLRSMEEWERWYRKWSSGSISLEESHRGRVSATFEPFGIKVDDRFFNRFQTEYLKAQGELVMSGEFSQFIRDNPSLVFGVITNGPAARQRAKCEALGLYRMMNPALILISGEIGCSKPSPRIFRLWSERAGIDPSRCLMVGDSYTSDVKGALDSGWQAIWLKRGWSGTKERYDKYTALSERDCVAMIEERLKR